MKDRNIRLTIWFIFVMLPIILVIIFQNFLCHLFHHKSWLDIQYESEMEGFI